MTRPRRVPRPAWLWLVLPLLSGCASVRLPAAQPGQIGVPSGRAALETRYEALARAGAFGQ